MQLRLKNNTIMSEILKIGDELCHISIGRRTTYYTFSKIKRFTKTQIILENGIKLKRNPYLNSIKNVYVYPQIKSYAFWQITTPELLHEFQLNEQKNKVEKWFNNKDFTYEEKEMIYNMFNK